MLNLPHLLIIWRSPEHYHEKGCLLTSNQKADEIREAAVGLLSVPDEYRLNFDLNFIKFATVTLLVLSVSSKKSFWLSTM